MNHNIINDWILPKVKQKKKKKKKKKKSQFLAILVKF